ncbi:DMT family transporter [Roseateles saccharophilus]|uniref:Drug/metabolite transporter (DMT)-like permease n=1 Tax=Roseateles saccharophilus TaxID=304 RepID=A0A4R3VC68_ROSSA|nr:DMT family transporter [Roseateles saccharophilus]MDG0831828.1 DMT family transporter [Roseateles saccharophilus]TCV01149.1 drug/metabolite transporter (DMT)-like permease [Roseateles saccharophilus]
MLLGLLFALVAGLMWGMVFVAPVMLPDYAPLLLTLGRYLAFGLIALPLALLLDRRALRELQPEDWREAARLSLIGNFLYYLCLSAAIQRAGAPLPTMIIGTLPVVIALCANHRNRERDGQLPWPKLAPSLALIAAGLALVNRDELHALQTAAGDPRRYAEGALLAIAAVACWTWYPIRNADWLRAHADRSPRAWATAQGLVTLPVAAAGVLLLGLAQLMAPGALIPAAYAFPFGATPLAYIGLMAVIGLCSSWLGTLCWNEASQRLPTSLSGQLIVFETLAALAYAFALQQRLPPPATLAGVALLIAGVVWALRIKPVQTPQ